jgi:carboxymethylenebutenolidase
MNQHPEGDLPWVFVALGRLSRTGYDEAATMDARRRILAFFAEHLS